VVRERPSRVLAEVEKLVGVAVKVAYLMLGDYCIGDAVDRTENSRRFKLR
jgi:hypothetical protein